ncbi:hypothetical protein ACGGZK_11755 [Agromyces sp. MMS24-K17]|uniref:hypothetical protein n=1 Tax=Agromyces sp. MMS24-K17 TaxID=3372850 RepID=UPI003753F100
MVDGEASEPNRGERALAVPSRFVAEQWRSEHAVHGVVLVSALIAVGWQFDTDLEVLGFILGSVTILWLTHVYAAVVASRRTPEGRRIPIWRAIGTAAAHTSGLLLAMLIPSAFLLLAVFGWVDEYVAYYLALWVGVVILAIIGWINSTRNESPWWLRVLSSLITAAFGLGVIWLGTLIH